MAMARIGATPNGGVDRQALTQSDADARMRLLDWANAAGLSYSTDRLGNNATQIVRDAGENEIEVAQPFTQPFKDGKPIVNYIAFAFRKEDQQLLADFNRELAKFLGSPEHKALLSKYAIIQPGYPIDKTTAELCGE